MGWGLDEKVSECPSFLRASLIAQLVKNPPAMQETPVPFLSREDPTPVFLGFPCGSAGKESACHVGDLGSIPGEGNSCPLQLF